MNQRNTEQDDPLVSEESEQPEDVSGDAEKAAGSEVNDPRPTDSSDDLPDTGDRNEMGLDDIDVGEFGDEPDDQEQAQGPEDVFAQVQAERDELKDRLMRMMADYQNFARRSRLNIEDARREAIMSVAKALLTPLDQFEHALGVDPDTTDAKDILKGVWIVRDEFLKALDQFEIKQLEAEVGEPFDPNRHEALVRQQVEGLESDRVAMQLQHGYTIKDKVLRPAKVAVSQ